MREKRKESGQGERGPQTSPNQTEFVERTIKSDKIQVKSLSNLDLSLVVKGFE